MNNELVAQPSWWKKNWKWVVPVGGCFSVIVFIVILFGSIFYGVTTLLEKSKPYKYALEQINSDEEITSILGAPIEQDGMMQGSLNWTNGDGKADMKIPVTGPNGSGILYINASSVDDNWTYHEIRLDIKDIESIDLLEADLEEF